MYVCIRLNNPGNWACNRLTEDADFRKKNYLFRWSSFWSWRLCKQAKLKSIEKPTQPKRGTVWCGFWSSGIIGPFFFENEQREAVTVNSDRYRAILNEFLFTKIQEEIIDNIWFQQDGATCYTAEATLDILRPVFLRSHYQLQSWCRLANSELWCDTVGLLFVGCRQK